MIPDLLASLTPSTYPRFADEKTARTSRYVAFLSIIFLAALGIAIKLRLTPLFTQSFAWLETSMPVIQFTGSAVKSNPPGPLRLEHPRYKDIALMIDTTRVGPLTAAEFSDKKVVAFLTARELYLAQNNNQMRVIDLSKTAANKPFTVDAAVYRGLERGFNWIFYPTVLLIAFLGFATSIGVCALMYALIGMILASMSKATLSFGQFTRLGIHAQTAGCLLYSLDTLLPFAIPLLPLISFGFSLTVFWLGVRATSSPSATPNP